jgi:hypothetical protein
MILDDPHDCPECGTRRVDVLPSRGDCQTCLKARDAAIRWFARIELQPPAGPSPALLETLDEIARLHDQFEAAVCVPGHRITNDRHDWHCPCVACRIDRGED